MPIVAGTFGVTGWSSPLMFNGRFGAMVLVVSSVRVPVRLITWTELSPVVPTKMVELS